MNKANPLSSLEYLNSVFRLDSEAGKLYWKPRKPSDISASSEWKARNVAGAWSTKYADKEALNCLAANGYLVGRLCGKRVLAHRIIFKMTHGFDPVFVDHINGIRTDNRPQNLRSVCTSENGKNKRVRKSCTSGVQGVYCKNGRWISYIRVDGKKKHLGVFSTLEEAYEARQTAKSKYGYHPNHGVSATTVSVDGY